MKAVESSASYRGARAAYEWAGRCATASLTGRGLLWVGRILRPPFSDSLSFGTARLRSVPLRVPEVSPAAAAIGRPALAAREAIGSGHLGRGLRSMGAATSSSALAGRNWLSVLGAAVLGIGCGTVPRRAALGVILLVIGLALVAVGHRAGSLSRLRGVGWSAVVLALTAGVLAGAGPDTLVTVGLAAVVVLAGATLWRPQLMLLVVAAFPWVDWLARNTVTGLGPLWDEVLLVIGVALVTWSIVVLGRDVPRSAPIALPVLFMLAAALASIVVNGVPNGPALYSLRVLFQPILFYFVAFLMPKDRRWVRLAVGVFLATTSLLALHGLYQFVTHAPMPAAWVDVSETSIITRAFSIIGNPNLLGGMLIMGSLVSISLVLSRAFSGLGRLVLVAASVVQLVGVAVTFSRGAWIGFVAGLIAMVVLGYRRYLLGVAVVAVVAWFVAPRVFIERLLFSFSSTYVTKSATGLGRLWRWESALQHVADKPLLGLGLGTFGGTTAALFGYWSIWVDNYYLQMAAEGGLLLLAFFLWLLWRNLKGLVRAHAVTDDPYLKALAVGVFGAVVAVIVADFFEADWEGVSVAVGFWFLCGLATSAALVRPEPFDENAASGSRVSQEAPE